MTIAQEEYEKQKRKTKELVSQKKVIFNTIQTCEMNIL